MTLTVELPDDLAQREDSGREALEALVISGFRSEVFTHYEAAQMLGFGRIEFDEFLVERGVTEHFYGVAELVKDMEIGDRLRAEGKL